MGTFNVPSPTRTLAVLPIPQRRSSPAFLPCLIITLLIFLVARNSSPDTDAAGVEEGAEGWDAIRAASSKWRSVDGWKDQVAMWRDTIDEWLTTPTSEEEGAAEPEADDDEEVKQAGQLIEFEPTFGNPSLPVVPLAPKRPRPLSKPLGPSSPKRDYFLGSWHYDPLSKRPAGRCPAGPVPGESKAEKDARDAKRAAEVAKWVWKPSQPGEWKEWKRVNLVKRLLASDMGLLLVGGAFHPLCSSSDAWLTVGWPDSLTGQQHLHLMAWLGVLEPGVLTPSGQQPPFLRRPSSSELKSWPKAFHQHRAYNQMYFLDPSAARRWFPTLDPERLNRPVLTFIRADFLLHAEEVSTLMEGQNNVTVRKEAHPEAWREWSKKWLGEAGGGQDLEARGKSKRSVVVLSTGPHWTGQGMMGGGDRTEEVERMKRAYDKMAEEVVDFFRPYAWKVHLVYRTLTPGHPACSDQPATSLPLLPSEKLGRQEPWSYYGWDLFKTLDDVWKTRFAALEGEVELARSRGKVRDGWKVDVMDVRAQALARGDAHSGASRGDCLHVSPA